MNKKIMIRLIAIVLALLFVVTIMAGAIPYLFK